MIKLSIIIINYNSKLLLEQCLASVKKETTNIDSEVIVVDNNSTDGSKEYLPERFTNVKYIFNKENLGFSKACNQGFTISSGKYVLFLNPDTILSENCLSDSISFFELQPDAGAIGVRMINKKERFLKESKRGLPTPAASFYKLFGLSAIFPGSRIFSKYYEGHLSEKDNNPVEVLSGAFMMVRREVFEKLNGFDERFFMYGEDIDLSIRIIQAGYKNYYLGKITVTHLKGGSTKYDDKYVQNFYGAMKLFVKKHYSTRSFLFRSFLYSGISIRRIITKVSLLFNR